MSLKEAKSDEFYCKSVAKSISEIIRFSLDEDFRKSSYKLFGVSCTKETEKEISKRLMSIIKNKTKTSRKRRKKSTEEKGEENLEEPTITSDSKDENPPASTSQNQNVGFQTLSEKFSQKNWLEISSQKYREAVKRRKLNFFSQPLFSQTYESNFEFSKSDLYFSRSQPTSSVSGSSSIFNETIESSGQVLDNGVNFCQKMFEVSFKDNAKYLRKNSKFCKNFSFSVM